MQNRLVASSRKNPCPVCNRTKDGDCRISQDSNLVLCHTEVGNHTKGEVLNGYIWIGEVTEPLNWGKWLIPSSEPRKNPDFRPVDQKFQFDYTDASGKVLTRKIRIYQQEPDGSTQKKDWWEPKGVDSALLVPYRYLEAVAALKANPSLPLFIDESEMTVDELWKLGLPAIAVGRPLRDARMKRLLSGFESRLVICHDQDQVGVQKASKYLNLFPMAATLKPYPESDFWMPEWLPAKGGLDVRDWILEDQLTAEEILNTIEWPIVPVSILPPGLNQLESEFIDQRIPISLKDGQITRALTEIEQHLAHCVDPKDRIYLQGYSDGYFLSRVLPAGKVNLQRVIELPRDIDTLEVLTPDTLHYELNRRFRFERFNRRTNESYPCDCPKALAVQFLSMGRWPNLPRLTGISYIPLLLNNGTIVTEPGYHPETGMLLQFQPNEFPVIAQNLTKEDAVAALAVLQDWLKEFPFQKPEDESAALSAVLTAVSRRLFKQAPLHALSATKAGTGKGTLVKGISTLLLGSHPGVIPWTNDGEEFRKKVTSFLKSGSPMGSIDNVTGKLGGDVLEMILTEPFFKDRLLGSNQMPSFSTQIMLMANGNNLRFKPDMTRRTILCVLDAECESPEHRNFERDFEAYTEEHRGELVMAAISVLKAYLDQDSPLSVSPKLGNFGQWSDLVRSTLIWLGLPDPVSTQTEISDQDDEKQLLSALLTVWSDKYGNTPRTSKEIISQAISDGSGDFREVLLEICLDRKGDLSPRRLGEYLKRHSRSVVQNMRFEISGKDRKGFALWKVVTTKVDWRETDSAPSAQNAETTLIQAFDPAESENVDSAPYDPIRCEDPVLASQRVEMPSLGFADSAGLINDIARVVAISAESAESDSSQSILSEQHLPGNLIIQNMSCDFPVSVEIYLSEAIGWQNGASLIRAFEGDQGKIDLIQGGVTYNFAEVQLPNGQHQIFPLGQVRLCNA